MIDMSASGPGRLNPTPPHLPAIALVLDDIGVAICVGGAAEAQRGESRCVYRLMNGR